VKARINVNAYGICGCEVDFRGTRVGVNTESNQMRYNSGIFATGFNLKVNEPDQTANARKNMNAEAKVGKEKIQFHQTWTQIIRKCIYICFCARLQAIYNNRHINLKK
jgi:hypothetical protein